MFGLQFPAGPRCHVCGKSIVDPTYIKDEQANSMYWLNPNICKYTDVRLDFCGPIHSTKWLVDQIDACKNVTPKN